MRGPSRIGYLLASEDQERDPLVRGQIEELRRQNVEVHSLTLDGIDPDRLCGAVDQVILQVHRRGLTHLHAQFTKFPVCIARLVSRRMGISYSLGVRLSDLQQGGLDLNSLSSIVKTARFLVVDSEATRLRLEERLPRGGFERLVRIYGGVDLETFRPADPDSELFRSQPPLILALGRLTHTNGFDLLIEACALLKARKVSFQCTIAGSGEQYGRLCGLAERRGVAELVRMTSWPDPDRRSLPPGPGGLPAPAGCGTGPFGAAAGATTRGDRLRTSRGQQRPRGHLRDRTGRG